MGFLTTILLRVKLFPFYEEAVSLRVENETIDRIPFIDV